MDLKHAKLIVKAAGDIGRGEVTLYENYSGRGMYGKTTAGVVGSLGDVIQAVAYAASGLVLSGKEDEAEEFVRDMRLGVDGMGRDNIYY